MPKVCLKSFRVGDYIGLKSSLNHAFKLNELVFIEIAAKPENEFVPPVHLGGKS